MTIHLPGAERPSSRRPSRFLLPASLLAAIAAVLAALALLNAVSTLRAAPQAGLLDPTGKTVLYYALRHDGGIDRAGVSLLERLPRDWQLQVLYDPRYEGRGDWFEQASRCVALARRQGRNVLLTAVPVRYFVAAWKAHRNHIVNALNLDNRFWQELVIGEVLLLFQSDAAICGSHAAGGGAARNMARDVAYFERFALIGAPWDVPVNYTRIVRKGPNPPGNLKKKLPVSVGNGGVTLRSKSFMLRCLKDYYAFNPLPEDIFFSQCLALIADNKTILAPTAEEASQFAVETVFHSHPAFVHQFYDLWKLHGLEKLRGMLDYCPESFFLAEQVEEECQKEIRRTAGHEGRVVSLVSHGLENESDNVVHGGGGGDEYNETLRSPRPNGFERRLAADQQKSLEQRAAILNTTICTDFVETLLRLRRASEVAEPLPPSSQILSEHAHTFEKPPRTPRETVDFPIKFR